MTPIRSGKILAVLVAVDAVLHVFSKLRKLDKVVQERARALCRRAVKHIRIIIVIGVARKRLEVGICQRDSFRRRQTDRYVARRVDRERSPLGIVAERLGRAVDGDAHRRDLSGDAAPCAVGILDAPT